MRTFAYKIPTGNVFVFAILISAFLYGCEGKAEKKLKDNEGVSTSQPEPTRSYAQVNGLNMYYEIHGEGQPLVLLHGAYSAIPTSFGNILDKLAQTRKVIAVELQGHGRTADIDRAITYENMADDVAALIKHLSLNSADIYGYSMGSGVALQVAIRHPEVVNKLVLASPSYKSDGVYPEVWSMISTITPEMFEGSPFKNEYDSLAPNKENWPNLVAKLKQLDETEFDWKAETIKNIKSPALIIMADSDIISPEHAVEMFRLFGGGVIGDFVGLPHSQLAIVPGATHITLINHENLLLSMIVPFLDRPVSPSL